MLEYLLEEKKQRENIINNAYSYEIVDGEAKLKKQSAIYNISVLKLIVKRMQTKGMAKILRSHL